MQTYDFKDLYKEIIIGNRKKEGFIGSRLCLEARKLPAADLIAVVFLLVLRMKRSTQNGNLQISPFKGIEHFLPISRCRMLKL